MAILRRADLVLAGLSGVDLGPCGPSQLSLLFKLFVRAKVFECKARELPYAIPIWLHLYIGHFKPNLKGIELGGLATPIFVSGKCPLAASW